MYVTILCLLQLAWDGMFCSHGHRDVATATYCMMCPESKTSLTRVDSVSWAYTSYLNSRVPIYGANTPLNQVSVLCSIEYYIENPEKSRNFTEFSVEQLISGILSGILRDSCIKYSNFDENYIENPGRSRNFTTFSVSKLKVKLNVISDFGAGAGAAEGFDSRSCVHGAGSVPLHSIQSPDMFWNWLNWNQYGRIDCSIFITFFS